MATRLNYPNVRRFPHLEILDDRCLPSTTNAFLETDLVSDQAGKAALQDANLVNPWGIALSPTAGAFWVSDNGKDVATLYTGDVAGSTLKAASLVVNIPGGAPTGQVFNSTSDFVVTNGADSKPAVFIFASEAGEITGWNPGVPLPAPSTNAQVGVTVPGAVFKGVTIGTNATGNFLFATDFAHGKIDVFDKNYTPATLAGNFTDPHMQTGFAPFNIQNLGGTLYVTYAKQQAGSTDEAHGQGLGFVDAFDTNGNFLNRVVTRGQLNAPWGLAMAPASFGKFGGDLLVGNFGDGRIQAYDATTGGFRGTLKDANLKDIRIEGLWGLTFGNGVTAGDKGTLYFTAGTNDEADGLFGSLKPTTSKAPPPFAVVAADAGGGPHVKVFDADDNVIRSFFAFDSAFHGGVRVAVGDVNGDGTPDIVTAAGPSGGPQIRVFSGADGSVLYSFFAYDTSFRGGLSVAVGDTNGDGFADIITAADSGGGPQIKVFSGADGSLLLNFFAYDSSFRGGVRVAAADVNGDGTADIITAAAVNGALQIKVFDGATGTLLNSFSAGNSQGGVSIAAGDLDGDSKAEIVVGAAPGATPLVQVFNGLTGAVSSSFMAYDSKFTGGVRVTVRDFNDDGLADVITGPGSGGGPDVRLHHSTTQDFGPSFFAFDSAFRGGVFVG
jgi:uncharacterized protein (TIGR03118 family)